jgi:hypothetical protein
MIFQGCSSFNSPSSQFELWSSFHTQSLFNVETKILKPRKKAKKKGQGKRPRKKATKKGHEKRPSEKQAVDRKANSPVTCSKSAFPLLT